MMNTFVRTLAFAMLVVLFVSQSNAQSSKTKILLPFVPGEIKQLTVIRPSDIVRSDDYSEFKAAMGKDFDKILNRLTSQYFKFSLAKFKEIDSVVTANWLIESETEGRKYNRQRSVLMINTLNDHGDQFDMATHAVKKEFEFENKTILQLKRPMDEFRYVCILNDKSIVWSEYKESIETVIKAGEKAALKSDWYQNWKPFASKPFSMVQKFEPSNFDYVLESELRELKNAETVITGCDIGKTVKATVNAVCSDKKQAAEFIGGAKSLVEKFVPQLKKQFDHNPLAKNLNRQLDEAVNGIQYKQKRNVVSITASMKLDFESLVEPLNQIHAAQARTFAANQLRQNAIAMHNFVDAMGHFPKSVHTHESGKKYSWRIEILPYIGHKDIYDQYDFTQEWDSAHNLEVTSQMPDVFRSDMDDPDSTNASFFLLTGTGGMFGGDEPIHFRELTDGSSNTILAVEARRDVHWAKPEDIMIDPDQALPDFGGFHEGGFNVVYADGSVSFLPENVAERYLRGMFTPNGGEITGELQLEPDLESDDPFDK